MFHSYPCAYYVQSPSTISHANSADIRNNDTNIELIDHQSAAAAFHNFHSPETNFDHLNKNPEVSRSTLSRYSSSRGSNNSFLHDKKIVALSSDKLGGVNRLIIIDHGKNIGDDEVDLEDDDEEIDGFYGGRKRGWWWWWWWRFCSFRSSSSCAWISLQIFWRLLLSLGVALLVFYIATKPPPPKISVKV